MTVACLPAIAAQESQIGFKRELGKALWQSFQFLILGYVIIIEWSYLEENTRSNYFDSLFMEVLQQFW